MDPLNKLNKVFDITEAVVESTTYDITKPSEDKSQLMEYLQDDFMNARHNLNEIIRIGKSSISYISAGVDDPRTVEAMGALINSINQSVKVLLDIYLVASKIQGDNNKEKVNKINNQVNIISTNLNEVIASLKNTSND